MLPFIRYKEHHYSNLNENSFEEIIKSKKFQDVVKYVEENVNVHKCMPTCRQHNANKYLWRLKEDEPMHLNLFKKMDKQKAYRILNYSQKMKLKFKVYLNF